MRAVGLGARIASLRFLRLGICRPNSCSTRGSLSQLRWQKHSKADTQAFTADTHAAMARTPRATLFLLTITASAPSSAASANRKYRRAARLRGGYTAVPSSYINDDYCDCATAPTSPALLRVLASRQQNFLHARTTGGSSAAGPGAGVCDCCDGKDEAEGHARTRCSRC